MKTYTFKVILEKDKWPDEPDEKAVWRASIPILPAAHAWGDTKHQALENLKNAVDLIIEDLIERGETIPEEPHAYVQISDEPLVSVTV
ncbi:MAG: type II toxin-antitoxin system HicB family antitoxin [Candidatus Tectomicrobia bacterium]|nr:type II toxin-antitoxin system HicB family antitoxin [Candidatus Tectomicrobia bacterium]